ncbi:hypothetical protein E3E11_03535 [Oecophyllibacter saccharovorans]|nr:hypothetical protein E3E11_03535 [Oecophyllibacter saccharovorans]
MTTLCPLLKPLIERGFARSGGSLAAAVSATVAVGAAGAGARAARSRAVAGAGFFALCLLALRVVRVAVQVLRAMVAIVFSGHGN